MKQNLIERIKAKTPENHKFAGKISTTIGVVCGAILSAGVVINPLGITLLTIGTALFGGKALYHAQKTENDGEYK